MNDPSHHHTLILGGGISGLVTAWSILQRARQRGARLTVTILEGSGRVGGNLVTDRVEGFVVDGGPDSWVASKPAAAALCRDLGLGDELIETVPENRRIYIAHGASLAPMPDGVVLGVPTKLRPMLRTPLLSWRAKARLVMDRALPLSLPQRGSTDVALGDMVARRLGREVVTAFTEPLLAGIYAGDAWSLSASATFPALVDAAAQGGSLMLNARDAVPRRFPGQRPPSAFISLRRGVGSLVDALVTALPPGTVRTNTAAASVAREGDGYVVTTEAGERIAADRVVVAMPMHRAAKVVRSLDAALGDRLDALGWSSVATAFFAYPKGAVGRALDATGFVVPKREGRKILASTWVSSKWPGRAPEGTVLLRAFVGGLGHEDRASLPDKDIVAMCLGELSSLVPLKGDPLFTRVYRFLGTSPQPTIGHASRVAAIRKALENHHGLVTIGAGYEGVGIPDVVALARRTGERIADEAPLRASDV
jgi:oxygen-dependent protoporphyrinogen oxidase